MAETGSTYQPPGDLNSLFEREIPKLVAFLRARVGGVVGARESILDIVQSVCREAIPDLPRAQIRNDDEFRRWLFARSIRKVCNRYRFHNRDRRAPDRELAVPDHEAEELLRGYETLATPSRCASAREDVLRFEEALRGLPDDQREAIALTRVAGVGYAEAADSMGRSESSVRGLVLRGLTELSRRLDPDAEK